MKDKNKPHTADISHGCLMPSWRQFRYLRMRKV